MPVYTFFNNKTNEEYDLTMSYDEMMQYIKDNPDVDQVFKMNLVDPVGIGVTKPPSDFSRHVIGRIKEAVPGAEKEKLEKRWSIPREI